MKKNALVFDCELIQLPKIGDRNGQITAVNNNLDIPLRSGEFFISTISLQESQGVHMPIFNVTSS